MRSQKLLVPVIAAAVLSLTGPAAFAQTEGRTVLSFLKIGVDARAAAMGEAFVAVSDNSSSTYWNPAALLGIERNDVMGMHNAWFQDLRHEFLAGGIKRGRHAFGIAFVGLYSDDIERRTENGAPAGHFGFSDIGFSGSYAIQISQEFGLGATARYLRESLDDNTMAGWAFDFGGTWDTPVNNLRAGAALRNVGGKMKYNIHNAQEFDLPSTLQTGLAYTIPIGSSSFLASGDVVVISGEDTAVRLGGEYAFHGFLSAAVGYKSGLENENVSFGLGYHKNLRVDYAFTPIYNDLGNSHRFSVGFAW